MLVIPAGLLAVLVIPFGITHNFVLLTNEKKPDGFFHRSDSSLYARRGSAVLRTSKGFRSTTSENHWRGRTLNPRSLPSRASPHGFDPRGLKIV